MLGVLLVMFGVHLMILGVERLLMVQVKTLHGKTQGVNGCLGILPYSLGVV